ncbi:MAG: hypothetical protein NZ700_04895, partial [Gemmataceae bacterium]|nr:hypothetical protein [Gemmataceae bacterium]MDW8267439.1 hypothetical protein [Gemmataceae bacterium]
LLPGFWGGGGRGGGGPRAGPAADARRLPPLVAGAVSLIILATELPSMAQHSTDRFSDWSAWEWMAPVELPVLDQQPTYFAITLTPTVFDKAQLPAQLGRAYERLRHGFDFDLGRVDPGVPAELPDLRLVDGQGQEVPFALRVWRPVNIEQPVTIKRQFDAVAGADGSAEVSLELEGDPVEHNEIVITTQGSDFRRPVEVFGSDSGQPGSWKLLMGGGPRNFLFRYTVNNSVVEVRNVKYPESRLPFLRVRVFPDRSIAGDAPKIGAVEVRRSIVLPGKEVTQRANLGPRQPVRGDGGPGSAWIIDWYGEIAPCQRLSFQIADEQFVRRWRLEAQLPDESDWYTVSSGQWQRRPGSAVSPMTIDLPAEIFTRRLRLTVTDFNNPPLTLEGVSGIAPVREVIFARSDRWVVPLRLYFGNPFAGPPHYDFAANLPLVLDPPPAEAFLKAPTRNPAFRPTLVQLSERWPAAVYLVLGFSSLVLLAILGLLARDAMRRHDQKWAASP